MHVKRYHRSVLAKHKEHMDRWCVVLSIVVNGLLYLTLLLLRCRVKDRFAEKEERLEKFYETGAFEGKSCVSQELPLWSSVVPGIAFNLALCGLALYLLINCPVAACTWFALTTAMSVLQARNFGN
jgi:hypothetical protein